MTIFELKTFASVSPQVSLLLQANIGLVIYNENLILLNL